MYPDEVYKRERVWNNQFHHEPYPRAPKPYKRRQSHLHDIWGPNFDEDECQADRYKYRRPLSPNKNQRPRYHGHNNKSLRLEDQNSKSKIIQKKYNKKEIITKSAAINLSTSSTSTGNLSNTSTSTGNLSNTQSNLDMPNYEKSQCAKPNILQNSSDFIVKGGSVDTNQKSVLKKANLTLYDVEDIESISFPPNVKATKHSETQFESQNQDSMQQETLFSDISQESITSQNDKENKLSNSKKKIAISLNLRQPDATVYSDISQDSICSQSNNKTGKLKDSQPQQGLSESLSKIEDLCNSGIDDIETSIDIESTLQNMCRDTSSITVNDIDQKRSYLEQCPFMDDYRIMDMDLGSPSPFKQQSIPRFTTEELVSQLGEALEETDKSKSKVQETPSNTFTTILATSNSMVIIPKSNISCKRRLSTVERSPLGEKICDKSSKITKRRKSIACDPVNFKKQRLSFEDFNSEKSQTNFTGVENYQECKNKNKRPSVAEKTTCILKPREGKGIRSSVLEDSNEDSQPNSKYLKRSLFYRDSNEYSVPIRRFSVIEELNNSLYNPTEDLKAQDENKSHDENKKSLYFPNLKKNYKIPKKNTPFSKVDKPELSAVYKISEETNFFKTNKTTNSQNENNKKKEEITKTSGGSERITQSCDVLANEMKTPKKNNETDNKATKKCNSFKSSTKKSNSVKDLTKTVKKTTSCNSEKNKTKHHISASNATAVKSKINNSAKISKKISDNENQKKIKNTPIEKNKSAKYKIQNISDIVEKEINCEKKKILSEKRRKSISFLDTKANTSLSNGNKTLDDTDNKQPVCIIKLNKLSSKQSEPLTTKILDTTKAKPDISDATKQSSKNKYNSNNVTSNQTLKHPAGTKTPNLDTRSNVTNIKSKSTLNKNLMVKNDKSGTSDSLDQKTQNGITKDLSSNIKVTESPKLKESVKEFSKTTGDPSENLIKTSVTLNNLMNSKNQENVSLNLYQDKVNSPTEDKLEKLPQKIQCDISKLSSKHLKYVKDNLSPNHSTGTKTQSTDTESNVTNKKSTRTFNESLELNSDKSTSVSLVEKIRNGITVDSSFIVTEVAKAANEKENNVKIMKTAGDTAENSITFSDTLNGLENQQNASSNYCQESVKEKINSPKQAKSEALLKKNQPTFKQLKNEENPKLQIKNNSDVTNKLSLKDTAGIKNQSLDTKGEDTNNTSKGPFDQSLEMENNKSNSPDSLYLKTQTDTTNYLSCNLKEGTEPEKEKENLKEISNIPSDTSENIDISSVKLNEGISSLENQPNFKEKVIKKPNSTIKSKPDMLINEFQSNIIKIASEQFKDLKKPTLISKNISKDVENKIASDYSQCTEKQISETNSNVNNEKSKETTKQMNNCQFVSLETLNDKTQNGTTIDKGSSIVVLNNVMNSLKTQQDAFHTPNQENIIEIVEITSSDINRNMDIEEIPMFPPIKKEKTIKFSVAIQICTALKSECPELEKCNPLSLNPYLLQNSRNSFVENDCTEIAMTMESPQLQKESIIVKQQNDLHEEVVIIDVKKDIPIIDLTEDALDPVETDEEHDQDDNVDLVETDEKHELYQIFEEIDTQSTEKITLYRSDETQNSNEEEVQAMSASLLPSTVLGAARDADRIKSETKSPIIAENVDKDKPNECQISSNLLEDSTIGSINSSSDSKQEKQVKKCKLKPNINKSSGVQKLVSDDLITLENISPAMDNSGPNKEVNLLINKGPLQKNSPLMDYSGPNNEVDPLVNKKTILNNNRVDDIIMGQKNLQNQNHLDTSLADKTKSKPKENSSVGQVSAPITSKENPIPPNGHLNAFNSMVTSDHRTTIGYRPNENILSAQPTQPLINNGQEQLIRRVIQGFQSEGHSQNVRSSNCVDSGCASEYFTPQINSTLEQASGGSRQLPNNIHHLTRAQPQSWQECIADFVFLAIQNQNNSKEFLKFLKSKKLQNLAYNVEAMILVKIRDFKMNMYSDNMISYLKQANLKGVLENHPLHAIQEIFRRLQFYGFENLLQLYLYLDAIMSKNSEFYINHHQLRNLYKYINSTATAIMAKIYSAVSVKPALTHQQLETLNRQIEFCNLITSSFQNQKRKINVPKTPRRNSNAITSPVNSFPAQSTFSIHHSPDIHSAQISDRLSNNIHQGSIPNKEVLKNIPAQQISYNHQLHFNKINYNLQQQVPTNQNIQQRLIPQQRTSAVDMMSRFVQNDVNNFTNSFVNNISTQQRSVPDKMQPMLPIRPSINNGVSSSPHVQRTPLQKILSTPPSSSHKSNEILPTFKVPSNRVTQTRPVPKNVNSLNLLGNNSINHSSIQSDATSPANCIRQNSLREIHNSPYRVSAIKPHEETSNNLMPAMTQIKNHIYAPMIFSPNYVNEQVVSPPNTELNLNNSENIVHQTSLSMPLIDDLSVTESVPINELCVSQAPENASSLNLSSPIKPSESCISTDESTDSLAENEKSNETDEEDPIIIDLTWLDDMDTEELKHELDFIKKEEIFEDEVILNEEQFPVVYSPCDSGIESLPSPQVECNELVYHGRLCICEKTAEYICGCRMVMYCSNLCQKSDWIQHRPVCLKALSRQAE